jgi:hypothetical protein
MTGKYKSKPDWWCDRCGRPLWTKRSKWREVQSRGVHYFVCGSCSGDLDLALYLWEKPMWDRQRRLQKMVA